MATELSYPDGIPYRIPRPRVENGVAGTAAGGLLGLLLTTNPVGIIAAAALGNVLANQPPSLEAAIRSYLTKKGLPVIGFYRLGPRCAKVLFGYQDQYWIIESHAPSNPSWTPEKLDDWLYGDLVLELESQLTGIN